MFSGSNYPTSNLYFGHVWKILMLLTELECDLDDTLRTMAKEMKEKFDKYWFNSEDDDYGVLFAFAFILDPRCKLSVLRFCYEQVFGDAEATFRVTNVQFKLEKLLKLYTNNGLSSPSNINTDMATASRFNTSKGSNNNPSGNRKRKFDYFAKYDDKEASSSSGEKSMLDVYLDDPKLDRTSELDILAFWKENEYRYKELSHVARDILAVPITTVASESTFSIGSRILNKWKSSAIPENVEALITTRSWMFSYEANEDDDFVGSYVDWARENSRA